ncbi:aldo/keto reductase [Advenella mimigardefordensis]|uniref:Oxidoreductase Tas, aldo/keto reductase family n=1 Tax=Advenella mimigardefordensis (strain DSM 17166 / LMG 22922 / DPN7) TaxID=1247726 RepID=W0PGM5_ADVMD|nr:aldo/keto reductase [Advenella mimigardefordensis]AHG64400.1 oxidoreductase Tas, aldo/keto reductase family [Advenella mimigardefordensis DPN7]
MQTVKLGKSDLEVTDICLGTMTFGEQVSESISFEILDQAVGQGINFLDTAEMYSVPARAETFGATETIIGNWFSRNPQARQSVVLASKVAGPSRGMPWVREGAGMTADDIIRSCEGSLKRLQTDYIDLYQIHWPARPVPAFGNRYFDPEKTNSDQSTIEEQLRALDRLVREGKIRYVGLSNETPYGVSEFIRIAEAENLPRVASIQNPYCLLNRSYENALDETCHQLDVSLLAYSPLAFGLLTGKYDESGITGPQAPAEARIARYESVQKQRWGRAAALDAARVYNALARRHDLTPVQLAIGFCNTKWQVASTIIGVRTPEQLKEILAVNGLTLDSQIMDEIDAIRLNHFDPAQ